MTTATWTTATLPRGWRDRLVVAETDGTAPGRGHRLDPPDCVVSTLIAGRAKDLRFAAALVDAGMIDPAVLADRLRMVDDAHPVAAERVAGWLRQYTPG